MLEVMERENSLNIWDRNEEDDQMETQTMMRKGRRWTS